MIKKTNNNHKNENQIWYQNKITRNLSTLADQHDIQGDKREKRWEKT